MTTENWSTTLSEKDILASAEGSVIAKLRTDPGKLREVGNLGSTMEWERNIGAGVLITLNGKKITPPEKTDFLEFFCAQIRAKSPQLSDNVLRYFIQGGAQTGFGWNGFNYMAMTAQENLGIKLDLNNITPTYEIIVNGNEILLTVTGENISAFQNYDNNLGWGEKFELSNKKTITTKTIFKITENTEHNKKAQFICTSHEDTLFYHSYEIYKTRTASAAKIMLPKAGSINPTRKDVATAKFAYLIQVVNYIKQTKPTVDEDFKKTLYDICTDLQAISSSEIQPIKEFFRHTFYHQHRIIDALHSCEQEIAKHYAIFFTPEGKPRPEKLNISEKEITVLSDPHETTPTRLSIYEYVNQREHDAAASQLHRIQILLASNPSLKTKVDAKNVEKMNLLSTVLKANNSEEENKKLLEDFTSTKIDKINLNVFLQCLDKTASNFKKIKMAGFELAILNPDLHKDLIKLSSLPNNNPYSAKKYIKSIAKPSTLKRIFRKILGWTNWSKTGTALTQKAKGIRTNANKLLTKSSSLSRLAKLFFGSRKPNTGSPTQSKKTLVKAFVNKVGRKFFTKKNNAIILDQTVSTGKRASH
jgi:hypothetical protein